MKYLLPASLLLLWGCVQPKTIGLYDTAEPDTAPHIRDYYALTVFSDQLTSELWFTQSPACLRVAPEATGTRAGSGALSLEWNKQAGGCPWLGMGIGWDNWTGKNFESITDTAALSFWVKMKEGQSKGLPWAVGFEDFNGGQAWTGVTAANISGGVVTEEWTQVILPLANFPFEARDVDVTAIKQVIFQFESSGKAFVDDITIIPHKSRGRKEWISSRWMSQPPSGMELPVGNIYVGGDEETMYIRATVRDNSPLRNDHSGADIWNGDAIEVAFSGSADVDPRRRIFYDSDRHIGLKMGATPECYDWSRGLKISGAKITPVITTDGYEVEVRIPWSALGVAPWQRGQWYDVEVAIDLGDASGKRTEQYRWNSEGTEGFNFFPSLWGRIYIQP